MGKKALAVSIMLIAFSGIAVSQVNLSSVDKYVDVNDTQVEEKAGEVADEVENRTDSIGDDARDEVVETREQQVSNMEEARAEIQRLRDRIRSLQQRINTLERQLEEERQEDSSGEIDSNATAGSQQEPPVPGSQEESGPGPQETPGNERARQKRPGFVNSLLGSLFG